MTYAMDTCIETNENRAFGKEVYSRYIPDSDTYKNLEYVTHMPEICLKYNTIRIPDVLLLIHTYKLMMSSNKFWSTPSAQELNLLLYFCCDHKIIHLQLRLGPSILLVNLAVIPCDCNPTKMHDLIQLANIQLYDLSERGGLKLNGSH